MLDKPIPLENKWRERRHNLLMGLVYIALSLALLKPKNLTGTVVAVTVLPFGIRFAFILYRKWNSRFGGSKLMTLVWLILAGAALVLIKTLSGLLEGLNL
ncbi:hypothetical protein BZL41_16945 [Pseudomonas sp. PIC25]|uniref:hypothetical protein n=1 Tax=Pseudomonas sp. PIC25 TaxID=1958773 RepID=UPI000BAB87DB|nr:hypothetical protein [Pseudomonas sp. PIC25]PAU59563.1 hypothetical protein BZL41_16945 [Pseudomonas sp. PIC25]